MTFWKIIKFFEEIIFPYLCYGCSSPGQLFCHQCLNQIQRMHTHGRCIYCFRLLNMNDKKRCLHCLPSFLHRSQSLFIETSQIKSIYYHAVCEKQEASRFFVRAIHAALLLAECFPQQIIYDPSLKQIARMLTALQKGDCCSIPMSLWKQNSRAMLQTRVLCFLSVYPPVDEERFYIERVVQTPSMLISLFLQDQHL